jgi:hypothetical protein
MRERGRILWLTLAIVAGAGLGAVIVYFSRLGLPDSRKALRQLEELDKNSLTALKESVGNDHVPDNISGRIQDYTVRIGEAAAGLGVNERKPVLAAQRVFLPMVGLMADYEKAFKELDSAGGSSPATLVSQEVIQERIVLARRLLAANQALLGFFRSVEAQYRVELEKEALPGEMKTQVMSGFRTGASIDLYLKIRESDDQLTASVLKLLELLSRSWGTWSVQPKGELAFERKADLAEYQTLQSEMLAATERQRSAQKELLQRAEQQQRWQKQHAAKTGR